MTLNPERIAAGRVLLGTVIRSQRENLGLTRRQLAERTGLSIATIHQVEIGRRLPSLDSLDAVAQGLETTARFLLKGVFPWDGERPPHY
jgi:transcriptional regulator with XRE-family HTH domain